MPTATRVEVVEKALSILDAFSEERAAMSLTQIAQETGISKSSLPRLLNSLRLYGFLTRDDAKVYRLGPNLWRLGALYRRKFDLGELIRPILRHLVEVTGETASFYVRDREERVCLYRENSGHPIRHHLDEGSRLSIDRGAASHALRAAEGPADRVFTSIGERNAEVAAVAIRIFGQSGGLRGALCVSGLRHRFDERLRSAAALALQEAQMRLAQYR
ncbi:MAG: IclR family transcriptional regulator [Tropicimonas sp.]|uniref:IclR family transcriptional regulator n=1 Tax=Tropicimonas sp. TaxID=2067044 RepID=UPI003A88937A